MPYTLHPTPYMPYTLHPTPYMPYTLHALRGDGLQQLHRQLLLPVPQLQRPVPPRVRQQQPVAPPPVPLVLERRNVCIQDLHTQRAQQGRLLVSRLVRDAWMSLYNFEKY